MDDKESKKTPWGQLAEDLGAKPRSEAFERNQPPAVEIPAAEAPSEGENVSEAPPQAPSNWNALAGSLGLEVPEPSPPIAKIVPEPVEKVVVSSEPPSKDESDDSIDSDSIDSDLADSLPPLPSEVDQIMSEGDWEDEANEAEANEAEDSSGMSGEVAKNAFDALFSADGSALAIPSPGAEAFGAGVLADSEDTEEKAGDSEDGDKEAHDKEDGDKEQRPKRRRSRRRGRGRGRGGRKTEAEQPLGEEALGKETLEGENTSSADTLNGEDQKEETSEDGEKSRRRRPRRRSRRSASADDSRKTEPRETDPKEADDSKVATLYEEDESLDREHTGRDSTGHRNMPTWAEALSVIIEGNLELHSKAPSRQSSSSRGRGRGRGGRGRKKT